MAKTIRIGGIRVDLALGQAEFNRGIDEATRRLMGLQGQFKAFGDGINKVAKGIALAYVAKQVVDLGAQLGKLAEKGEIAGSIAEGFAALGGSSREIDKAKKATIGLVDQYELMATASKGLSADVKGFNENFAKIADLGARVANTLGTDTGAEIDKLTGLIVKGSEQLSGYGFNLEGLKTKAEKQKAVMEQLPVVMARYAEVTDSTANAQAAFNKALGEAEKEVGIAINTSDGLTNAWRELEAAVGLIDWGRVGDDLANIASIFMGMGTGALPTAIRYLNEFAIGLDYITGSSSIAKVVALDEKIGALKDKLSNPSNFSSLDLSGKSRTKAMSEAREELQKLESEKDGIISKEKRRTQEQAMFAEQTERDSLIKRQQFREAMDKESRSRELAGEADKIQKMQASWQKALLGSEQTSLKAQISKAIDSQDKASFDALTEQLRASVEKGFIAGQEDAIKAGAVSLQEVTDQAKVEGELAVADLSDSFVKKSEEASRESVQMWQGLFQNAITGVTFNLKDALEQVAVGFAAKLASATFGDMGLGKIGSATDLGGAIFDKLGLGGIFGGAGASSGGSAFYGPGGDPSKLTGAEASGLMPTLMAIVPYAAAAAGAYLIQHDVKNIIAGKSDNSAMGTAGRIQSGISSGGLSEVARFGRGFFGGGKRSPEAEAIHQVAGSLESLITKFQSITTIDPTGKYKTSATSGFNLDESRLKGNWAQDMNSWDGKARTVFAGLGEAIRAVNGIAEDVGPQIGYILGEGLGKSVDSARLNVQKLGLDFKDVESALVELGKSEKKTWLEVETAIQGASEAFKPGLQALGDTKGALDEIAKSGGRGVAALKGVRDAGIEGIEAKLKTLEQLKQKMLADGGDPEMVNAFFASIDAAGIKTLQELANVSDRVGGQIVAGLEARSPKMAAEWAKMSSDLAKFGADIDGYSKKLDGLKNSQIDVQFNLTTKTDQMTERWLDPELQAKYEAEAKKEEAAAKSKAERDSKKNDTPTRFALGGVIDGRRDFSFSGGHGMMGEAGPEAILPLKRVNGRLGVEASGGSGRGSPGVTLVINAPGADAGSEARLLSIASQIQASAIEGAVDIIMRSGY